MIGRSKARRFRRSSSLRRGHGRRRSSFLRDFGPYLKLGGIFVGGAAVLAVLVIFVIIPLFSGGPASTVSETPTTATPESTPAISGNISDRKDEPQIPQKSINDPYMYGGKIVYTTGAAGDEDKTTPDIKAIAIYDSAAQTSSYVQGITKKYDSLFEAKMNDKYIVYLDCKKEYGGAVCGYDIEKGESFVMREYLYGKPRVSISGKYALWMQQTAPSTDKLYLYDLEKREASTIEVFVNTKFFISSAYISENLIAFVQPEGQERILNTDSSSGAEKAQVAVIPLTESGDKQRKMFTPDTYVYKPMVSGNGIVYSTGPEDENSSLMYVRYENGTFTAPVEIAKDVLNYCVGDGYVAYTKDDAINIYYFSDGAAGILSPENTRACLANANGKDVIWYDVTDSSSDAGDIVFHIQVP